MLKENKNFSPLLKTNFRLSFDRLDNTTFFCQEFRSPQISLQTIKQPTPFIDLNVPGDKIYHDFFNITFIMDEDLYAWEEIHHWMVGEGFPENFDQYKNMGQRLGYPKIIRPAYSDAILTILSSQKNPIIRIKYKNCFPTSLDSFDMDTRGTTQETATCGASFAFQDLEFQRL